MTDMMIKMTSTGIKACLVGTPRINDKAITPAPPAKPMPIPPIRAPMKMKRRTIASSTQIIMITSFKDEKIISTLTITSVQIMLSPH
ncbi:hypothetical protein CBG37_07040 [Vibrio cholerae O139]|nr:hypothetical protein CBG37_07040 [Vibrio cholerae O139]CSA99535.1 Uncharacterised protein [Vibrio cholerae]